MIGLLGGAALFGAILLVDWLLVWLTPRNPDGTIDASHHLTRRAGEASSGASTAPSAGNARQPARRPGAR